MTVHFADIARHAATDRAISAEEILDLRRAGWADGRITRAEAESIFALQRAIADPTPEWTDFFVEAVKHYVLHGTEPRGYANDAEAGWLIVEIERDARVCSMAELELLVQITEKALNVPDALKFFILREIEHAVLTGTGPTRCGGTLCDTHITAAECSILRRSIFGRASDRPGAVSEREAEMLYRLKNATTASANTPEFRQLFVQGVGNFLMGFSAANAQISRERKMDLERFVAANRAGIGSFMGRMAKDTPNAFGKVFGRKPTAPSRSDLIAEGQKITVYEQEWLDRQIAANDRVDEYDQALLKFIAEEMNAA